MKTGVLLSGCGVFDGSEIHEATFALLAIDELGAEAVCMAPDIMQHHVLNHITGEEMEEQRNVLLESARIARGNIKNLSEIHADDLDALVLPGGFGAAKNLSKWAFSGPGGEINPEVSRIIREMHSAHKPICALCIAPTAIAKALEGSGVQASLTVGTTEGSSSNDIKGVMEGMERIGARAVMHSVSEIEVDEENKIVTAPCYMMDASISQIRANVKMAIEKLLELAAD